MLSKVANEIRSEGFRVRSDQCSTNQRARMMPATSTIQNVVPSSSYIDGIPTFTNSQRQWPVCTASGRGSPETMAA